MDVVSDLDPGTLPAEVVALQPVAIVDHLCAVDEDTLHQIITGEVGGSQRVDSNQIRDILAHVGEFHSKAGGSAANTARGLAKGFGIQCDLVGARGRDEWGALFVSSMKRAQVGMGRLRALDSGSTARCVVLSCKGQRTMRTCADGAAILPQETLSAADFEGAKWAFFSGYCLYRPGLLASAIQLAKQASAQVCLDLASFEVVRQFREELLSVLDANNVDMLSCNEDEAAELVGGARGGSGPEAALEVMLGYAAIAVVTLGERGCLARRRGDPDTVREPAAKGITVVDATGAGDLFASGFLYGMLRGYSLQRCCNIGCLTGGAVVQTTGAELSPANWQWLFSRLHGDLAATAVRDSATAVHAELLACYALIEKLGRGVVYYGSARLKRDSPHWARAQELGREVAELLGCTTWSGGGPGMMEAATLGALEAGQSVGGIRILREAGTAIRSAAKSYLPADAAVFCRFLSARKVALVDCGVRTKECDRTAYIFLPGGLGTCDELFEVLTLLQLGKLGSKHPVPCIICNYDGVYDGLFLFLQSCDRNGTMSAHELKDLMLATTNNEVLDILASFYGLKRQAAETHPPTALHRASSWILQQPSSLQAGDSSRRTSWAPMPAER